MRRIWFVALAGAVAIMVPGGVFAVPCGQGTPMGHASTFFACQDSGPVQVFAWQLTAPTTVNTGTEPIACESAPGCATAGDGQILIATDWANPGIAGCPVAAGVANRVVISAVGSDGQGLLVSLTGASELGYTVDNAHPVDASGNPLPIACSSAGGRPLVQGATTSGGVATLSLVFGKPSVPSDCDANSFGQTLPAIGFTNPCSDSFAPTVTPGHVYTLSQACNSIPDVRRTLWTANAATIDPSTGVSTVSVTQPTGNDALGNPLCAFVGGTVMINNNENDAITGFVRISNALAASPKALDVRAVRAGGNVSVTFRTDSEIGLASFNVLANAPGKGSIGVATLQPRGNGGAASYSVSIPVGNFKGAKSLVVESKLTDGTSIKSDPASF